MKYSYLIAAILMLSAGVGLVGWYYIDRTTGGGQDGRPTSTATEGNERLNRVIAQGRLLPVSGLINVFAPPNRRVEQILVQEGQEVSAGQDELATFAGQPSRQLQVQLSRVQAEEAARELDQKIVLACKQRQAAEVARRLAELQLEQAQISDLLSIPEQQLAAAEGKLKRLEVLAQDPKTKAFVSTTAVDEQRLAINEARIQLAYAQRQHAMAVRAAEMQVESAGMVVEQAELAETALIQLRDQSRALAIGVELADLALEEVKLLAPINGRVLRIVARPGEVSLHSPLMQIGDVSRMSCVAEVPDRLMSQVRIGQAVTISAGALPRPLTGKVAAIGRVVGDGNLPDPNPLALVDRRTVDVTIEIEASDIDVAAGLVNLQVTVSF